MAGAAELKSLRTEFAQQDERKSHSSLNGPGSENATAPLAKSIN